MTRFEDYKAAVKSGSVPLRWRHDLITQQGDLLATTLPEVSGNAPAMGGALSALRWDSNRVAQRSASLILPDNNLIPKYRSEGIHPSSRNMIRTYAGFVLDGEVQWHPQSTLVIAETVATTEGGATEIELQLLDRTYVLRSKITSGFGWDRGEPVEDVVARLASEVIGDEDIQVSPTGFTVPSGDLSPGQVRYAVIDNLLAGCGHEMVATRLGVLATGPIPSTVAAAEREHWTYGQSGGGIPIARAVRIWKHPTPQGWTIRGGSAQTSSAGVDYTVYDLDPTSEGYFAGPGQVDLGETRLPYVETVGQAIAAGYGQLRRHGVGPITIEFWTIPNPALRQNDLVSVAIEELDVNHVCRVLSYQLPVQADGLMRVVARGSYDPALDFDPPVDPGEGFLETTFDSFDRPDGNLENLEASPGSPDWTEIGWSWGISDNRAIQRYPDGWSLAYINTPLGSSNQYAEVEIDSVPSGRRVGPLVRSSGSFEGYTALIDANGVVRLEAWLDGKSVEVLGTHNTGQPPEGRTLRVTATGSTIHVDAGGSEPAIIVNDTRFTGSTVGMVGYGGQEGSNAPAVESFEAGAV